MPRHRPSGPSGPPARGYGDRSRRGTGDAQDGGTAAARDAGRGLRGHGRGTTRRGGRGPGQRGDADGFDHDGAQPTHASPARRLPPRRRSRRSSRRGGAASSWWTTWSTSPPRRSSSGGSGRPALLDGLDVGCTAIAPKASFAGFLDTFAFVRREKGIDDLLPSGSWRSATPAAARTRGPTKRRGRPRGFRPDPR